MAPIALAATYVGGWPFAGFWVLAAGIVLWEWMTLVAGKRGQYAVIAGALALAATLVVLPGRPGIAVAAIAVGAIVASMVAPRPGWIAGGVIYAGALLVAPILLRADADFGLVAIVYLFAVVWATDILAYFVGRALGGPKLSPALSPNKTWSGAIGGAAAAIVAGVVVARLGGISLLWPVAVITLVLSVASQAGDLFESALKRLFGAKDASHLIPGHGGLMDRLDGFVAAVSVAAVIGILRGGIDAPARGLLVW
jgi:phosphatidate cytidylyltransferase